jgi:hypothetical protein
MSEESEQVWESMGGALRSVRRRRMMMRGGGIVAVALFGAVYLQLSVKNTTAPTPIAESRAAEPDDEEAPPADDFRLAVFVYDDAGVRFEFMDGEQLGNCEMEFSLQPVVMGGVGDPW